MDYSQVAALHACHDLAWVAFSTLKSGDPLWVREFFWASRALAHNPKLDGFLKTIPSIVTEHPKLSGLIPRTQIRRPSVGQGIFLGL